jgi:ABC-type glycerol-3-phosphate transport system substrate-binding protein
MSVARFTRRSALCLMAAAGAGLAFRRARPRGVPVGRTEIIYWEKWTGREGAAMQTVVDRFNASQDRTWVTMVPVSDAPAKAMVAIGGGDPPDLVGLFTYNIPIFAEARALMPLDEFAGYRRLEPERYLPSVFDLLQHEGRTWAGVNTFYTLALYYNRALLHEAGAAEPPRTFSELDAVADRLTLRASDGRIERAGFLQSIPGWWAYFWPLAFGGSLFEQGRATIASPAGIRAFEWIRACARRYGVGPSRAFAAAFARNIHSAQDPFISGRVAMLSQGPWLANFIRAYNPGLDYAAAPMPVDDPLYDPERPIGILEADILAIPRGCPHPDEAFEFLAFTQRKDVQEELAAAHCKPSPFRDVSRGFFDTHPNPSVRIHDAIARSPRVQSVPKTRVWKQYSDLIIAAFDAIWAGGDPSAELARVQSRAQEVIDLAARRRAQREPQA